MSTRAIIYGVVMWVVCIYAFRRGGWEERIAASACVVASYLTPLVMSAHGPYFTHVERALAMVDAGYFVVLLMIVLVSRKFWPMWLAAMAGVTLLTHFLPHMPLPTGMMSLVYRNAEALWSWPIWILLAFAVRWHAQEQASDAHRA